MNTNRRYGRSKKAPKPDTNLIDRSSQHRMETKPPCTFNYMRQKNEPKIGPIYIDWSYPLFVILGRMKRPSTLVKQLLTGLIYLEQSYLNGIVSFVLCNFWDLNTYRVTEFEFSFPFVKLSMSFIIFSNPQNR